MSNLAVIIDRDENSVEIYNPHTEPVLFRGMLFEPRARMVRWFNQVPFRPDPSVWDREDDTAKINNGYSETPVYHGWCRPWGAPYGGVTGGEDIDMVVSADSPEELTAFYRKAERILDRMPDQGFRVAGYRRFDWQHIRRATGTLQALADRGDERAQKIMIRWAFEWIDAHADELEARQRFVEDFPSRGMKTGRDQGWGLLLLFSAYKYSGRESFKLVAYDWIELFAKAQTECGLIQRTTSDKLYGASYGKVGFWQCYEHAFIMNACWEWREELQKSRTGVAISSRLGLDDLLFKGSVSLINSDLWDEEKGGIIKNVAHGDSDHRSPSVCSNFAVKSSGVEGWYAHNLFAMAYLLTGNDVFLEKGRRITPHSGSNAALWFSLLPNE